MKNQGEIFCEIHDVQTWELRELTSVPWGEVEWVLVDELPIDLRVYSNVMGQRAKLQTMSDTYELTEAELLALAGMFNRAADALREAKASKMRELSHVA